MTVVIVQLLPMLSPQPARHHARPPRKLSLPKAVWTGGTTAYYGIMEVEFYGQYGPRQSAVLGHHRFPSRRVSVLLASCLPRGKPHFAPRLLLVLACALHMPAHADAPAPMHARILLNNASGAVQPPLMTHSVCASQPNPPCCKTIARRMAILRSMSKHKRKACVLTRTPP